MFSPRPAPPTWECSTLPTEETGTSSSKHAFTDKSSSYPGHGIPTSTRGLPGSGREGAALTTGGSRRRRGGRKSRRSLLETPHFYPYFTSASLFPPCLIYNSFISAFNRNQRHKNDQFCLPVRSDASCLQDLRARVSRLRNTRFPEVPKL